MMPFQFRPLAAMILVGVVSTPVFATPREGALVVMPENPQQRAVQEEWGYADAVVRGDTVYLSGVVAGLRQGETDRAAAYDRAFRRIQAILERAGSSWDDALEITTYHVDLADIRDFAAVKHRYVRAPFPAWTAIDVDRLVPDNGLVEIRVIAGRRAGAATPAR